MNARLLQSISVILTVLPALVGCQVQVGEGKPQSTGLQRFLPPTPADRAKQAFNMDSADQRREGIVGLSKNDWGLKEPYLKGYALLSTDPEPAVRSAAVNALGRAGDATYLPQIVKCMEDSADMVRLDAAIALDNVHGEQAVEPLRRHATRDVSLDVRTRSIHALRAYKTTPVVETLVSGLADEDFGVRYTTRATLTEMTGQDYGYDIRAWKEQLASKKTPFAATAPASSGPWWDWMGVTRKK